MSQVNGTYSITTSPQVAPPPALAITPASGSEGPFPAGAAITPFVIGTVSGGERPYQYAVTGLPSGTGYEVNESPSADGVAGDADVTLSGSPTAADVAASPASLSIAVTDSATTPATAKLTRKL